MKHKPANPSSPPAAPDLDPVKIRRGMAARQLVTLRAQQTKGRPLSAGQLKTLDESLALLGPAPEAPKDPPPPGAPLDVLAKTKAQLADLSGLHRNSLLNYSRAGIEPAGAAPWSVRDWFLLLRRAGKLGETKPTDKRAQLLRAWCFGNGDSADPDDPAHSAPQGWVEEKSRQDAIKTLRSRQREQIELETLRRERIPVTEYRARWRARAQEVLAAFDLAMRTASIADAALPAGQKLSQAQRQAVVTASRTVITEMRTAVAGKAEVADG
jgi:hypothetical protein